MSTTTEPPNGHRGGATYDPQRDYDRLGRQAKAVWRFMSRGGAYTLAEIETATGAPQASASARLRDFRKFEFGSHTIQRFRLESGAFRYRLVVNREVRVQA